MLAVGAQRSYSDVCRLTGGEMLKAGSRIIRFDDDLGILHCQAGATLREVAAVTVPRGWFFAVVPGTQYATIGGCIANDVHGKNHKTAGSFGNHVTAIALGHHVVVPGSPLFHATVGGLGLTGMMTWAEIRLRRCRPFNPLLYPLDYTPYWQAVRRLGIVQYQCVVPKARAIRRHMPRPLLMSTKTFGDIPSVGMLSFPRKGVAFALDYLPDTDLTVLDHIVMAEGGAVNPAKTSMTKDMFRHSFPRWKEFSQFVDPSFSSDFWRRVS